MSSNVQPIDLSEYWAILMRRKWSFLLAFVLVLGVGAAVALLLPATYRSEARFLIERQGVPSELVESTVSTYVQEQIEQIRQRILTYDNVLEIAKAHDLYPEQRSKDPSGVVRQVSENVEVAMVDVQASDPDKTGQRVATIAFTVAYSAPTPEAAKAVTNELAQRYLDVHKLAREEQAAQVTEFIGAEAEKLAAEVAELEERLAGFKQQELRQLPEMMNLNLKLYEDTQADMEASEARIRSLQDAIQTAQAELSLTQPYKEVQNEDGARLLSASDRLSMLTAQYLRDSGRYSAEHPDMVRMQREIRTLSSQTGGAARVDELMNQLARLQDQLREARQQYAQGHPEIRRLENAVASVERGFQAAVVRRSAGSDELAVPPDNPRYVALKTQIDTTQGNLQVERKNFESLQQKLDEYEARLFQTPMVERDFLALSRDYQNKLQKYEELRNKQMEASLAQQLEAGQSAEKFVLVSGAFLPSLPESPNRIGIFLLSGLFAFGAGLGSVTVREYADNTVRSSRTIVDVLGAPPLAIVPRL
ncbi:MAG: Wzz/FepE/Etk N-terminal domain-containing protein [Pseudomonadales bacterium]